MSTGRDGGGDTISRYVDDNLRDPYSARRGFWFSHIGWMLREYPSGKRDDTNIRDVIRDPIAAFQDRHDVPLVLATNIGLPVGVGWWAGDVWGVFLLGGLLRLVVNHHATFFINSLAHIWGSTKACRQRSNAGAPRRTSRATRNSLSFAGKHGRHSRGCAFKAAACNC